MHDFPGWPERCAHPRSPVGLALRGLADRVFATPLLQPVAARFTQIADTDQALPAIPAAAA